MLELATSLKLSSTLGERPIEVLICHDDPSAACLPREPH